MEFPAFNMHKHFLAALAVLRMDTRRGLWYSIGTERKTPEIRNQRKFQVSHFQKEPDRRGKRKRSLSEQPGEDLPLKKEFRKGCTKDLSEGTFRRWRSTCSWPPCWPVR